MINISELREDLRDLAIDINYRTIEVATVVIDAEYGLRETICASGATREEALEKCIAEIQRKEDLKHPVASDTEGGSND